MRYPPVANTYATSVPATAQSRSSAGLRRASAQIEARQLIVRLDGARINFGRDSADRHDIHAAGEFQRERRLLFNEHDRKALTVQNRKLRENFICYPRRQPERRFVEQ